MTDVVRVAVAQLTSKQDVDANLAVCRELTTRAVAGGARLIAFPENAPFLGRDIDRLTVTEAVDGRVVSAFAEMATKEGIAISLGSIAETGPDAGHSYNTSLFIDEQGKVVATYRKIHLFDVQVEGSTAKYLESESVTPGTELVVASWADLRWGMSVCYDLRFPEMYRELRQQGADVLLVPSAFTERTGRDHWEVLLRARAIENQCYVIAADQYGAHLKGRLSFGRSMIIDPWGVVIAQVGDEVGLAFAEIDRRRIASIRRRMPCLDHARLL